MTVPYYGENVTCSELYENSDYKIIYFIADIDNDYQNELVFADMYWASPELVLDVALDGSLQVMNLSKDDYPAMYGAIAKIEGTTWQDEETWMVGADVSGTTRDVYVFYKFVENELVDRIDLAAWYPDGSHYDENSDFTCNGQKITMEQFEAILQKYISNNTYEGVSKLADEETYGWKPKYTFDEWRGL